MADIFQYYPTPPALALKAWRTFKHRGIKRLLEPSAGTGSLVEALQHHTKYDTSLASFRDPKNLPYFLRNTAWDAIEINPDHHPSLREKKAVLIGYDFLSFQHGAPYSHIIMNPPFALGATHVNHAWDILFSGEIVAIINAETIRNPFSQERKRLVRLIEQYGSVSFHEDAFITDETQRKTPVEVALIHLEKSEQTSQNLLSYLDELTKKETQAIESMPSLSEVMLPNGFIENAIINYNLAIAASVEAKIATEKLKLYQERLLSSKTATEANEIEVSTDALLEHLLSDKHTTTHHLAWRLIINSTINTHRLSRLTAKQVESQLDAIYALAFNATNIYGFIAGLTSQRAEIQKEMILEVFDDIVRYYSENTCYYLGWKSNDAHRRIGRSIKMSRFILPLGTRRSHWDSTGVKTLQDIESTFLYLDGKSSAEQRLVDVFEDEATFQRVSGGERVTTDYFDVRYYPTQGTMHFFPRRADLLQRLNLYVGQARQWLPEDMNQASESFVYQFDQAEKISKKINLVKLFKLHYANSLGDIFTNQDRREMELITKTISDSQRDLGLLPCLEDNQLNSDYLLESTSSLS